MTDTYDPSSGGGPLGYFFAPKQDSQAAPPLSYDALQMRRKLAMMLAARQRPYPKTIGEGLTALGEGWADRQFMDRMAQEEGRFQQAGDAAYRGLPPIPPEGGAAPPPAAAAPPPAAVSSVEPPATPAGDIPPQPSVDAGVGAGAPPVAADGTGVPPAPQGRVQLAARGDVATDASPPGRDAIAQALMQQNGVQPPAPVPVAQGPQQTLPPPPTQIQKAPPSPLQTPAADRMLGGPMQPDATAPRPTPMTDAEIARRTFANRPGVDPAKAKQAMEEAEILRFRREALDKQNLEQWRLDKTEKIQERSKRIDVQVGEEKRQSDLATAAQNLEDTKIKAAGITPEQMKAVSQLQPQIERTQRILSNLDKGGYNGLLGEADLLYAKGRHAFGAPLDPRVTVTEQLKSDLAAISGANRLAVVGPGAPSNKDMDLLRDAAAGKISLEPETIRRVTEAAQRVQLAEAMDHQRKLAQYVKENPGSDEKIYGRYGLNMEDFVPRNHPSVQRLITNPDPEHIRQFDEKYHTPGLAMKIIARESGR